MSDTMQCNPVARVPDFAGERQIGIHWCWLACSVMMARSLGITTLPNGRRLDQCSLYSHISGIAVDEACIGQSSGLARAASAYDRLGVVSDTLKTILGENQASRVRIERDERDIGKPALHDKIRWHVDKLKRPVAVLTIPNGGTALHYVMIIGYDYDRGRYTIWDPNPDPAKPGEMELSLRRWSEYGEWKAAVFVDDIP